MYRDEDLMEAFAYYPRLRKVQEFVEHQLENQITLENVARVAGLEKKYFSTFFRKKTGICFRDWVAYIRIKRSRKMMITEEHTIAFIAAAVGFEDLRTFERAFKKWTGMTPRAYKRSKRPRSAPGLESRLTFHDR